VDLHIEIGVDRHVTRQHVADLGLFSSESKRGLCDIALKSVIAQRLKALLRLAAAVS